jgi:hypothetical protein
MVLYPDLVLVLLLLIQELRATQEVAASKDTIVGNFFGVALVLLAVVTCLMNFSDRCLQIVGILTFNAFLIVSLAQYPRHLSKEVKVALAESEEDPFKEVYFLG